MAASKSMVFFLAVIAIAAFQLQPTAAQTRHVVGGSLGWTIPPNGDAAYTEWASGQTFTVGDTLFFNFTTNMHDVAEVSQAAYGPCTTSNTISTTLQGPATINLRTAGNHYYICTFGTHCQIGQKVTINVAAATGSTPPTTTATTPAPSGSTMPPPPPESGASSFTAVVPVTFLAAVVAMFY